MVLTIASALDQAQSLQEVSESWRLDAELLLAATLDTTRTTLHAWPERALTEIQAEAYQRLLRRRLDGEPVAYLTGKRAFWDFELSVSPAVLIPRPETELLVECALKLLQGREAEEVHIADLGTGSGAIALALARASNHWHVTATDISEAALKVARANAEELKVKNIQIRQTAWCEGLTDDSFDMIVSNPPYVAEGDPHLDQGDLRFEPSGALVASNNGMADLAEIVEQSRSCLKSDSWLLLEHGFDQQSQVHELLKAEGYSEITTHNDLGGHGRITIGRWGG